MPAPISSPHQKFDGVAGSPLADTAVLLSGGTVTWSASGLPAGISINATTGALSGTPLAATNNLQATLTATNADGSDSEIVLFLIEWPNPISVVRLRKNQFSTSAPFNDITLSGGYHRYARWRKTGRIPAGINWEGTGQGLRFWGTPSEAGTFIADFDGPYPPNFTSPHTVGGSNGDPRDCSNSYPIAAGTVGSVEVQRFQVQFVVTELSAPNVTIDSVQFFGFRTYGEAFSAILRGKLARRGAWGSNKRCIGVRPPTKILAASSETPDLTLPLNGSHVVWHYDSPLTTLDAQGATAYPIKNTQLTEDDIVGVDWQITDANMAFPRENILDTASAQRQFVVPETSSQYATFIGTPIDGKKWKTIAQADIPLSQNSRFFGEFILDADFQGDLEVMLWTSIDGRFSTMPLVSFGLKMLFEIMEQGISDYRSPNPSIAPPYDLAFTQGNSSGGILKTTVEHPEGKHGIYNLTCASLPEGKWMAHLTIFAKSFEP
ncbi:MAG: Ig domain-containing protein [Verrucomicrobiota bacterium]